MKKLNALWLKLSELWTQGEWESASIKIYCKAMVFLRIIIYSYSIPIQCFELLVHFESIGLYLILDHDSVSNAC